jgi:branched-chain amino acid transport system ATP-binding protein
MGRNGMGKSTLLKSIMGLVKPRRGGVLVMGKPMTGRPPYEIAHSSAWPTCPRDAASSAI